MPAEAESKADKSRVTADRFIQQYIALGVITDARDRGLLLAQLAKQTCIHLELPLRIEETTQQRCDRILHHIAAHYPDIMQNLNQSLQNIEDKQTKQIIAKTLDRVTENLNARVQNILKFPESSRLSFFEFSQEAKWVRETAKELRLLRMNMLNGINDEELFKKGGISRYKRLDNEFVYQIQLDILKNCNSESDLVSRVKRYLVLANECLKSGDPISANHIHGALGSSEIFNLTTKGSKFRLFLEAELNKLAAILKIEHAWTFSARSDNVFRKLDNFAEFKRPIRDSVDDQELVEYSHVVRIAKEPELKEMKPDMIAMLLQDGQLTAFWLQDGKIKNRAFSQEAVPHTIMEMLPKSPNSISKNEKLIQQINSKYGCDDSRKEKLASLMAESGYNKGILKTFLNECRKYKSYIVQIFEEKIRKLYPYSPGAPEQKLFVINNNGRQEVEKFAKQVKQKIKPDPKSKQATPDTQSMKGKSPR